MAVRAMVESQLRYGAPIWAPDPLSASALGLTDLFRESSLGLLGDLGYIWGLPQDTPLIRAAVSSARTHELVLVY